MRVLYVVALDATLRPGGHTPSPATEDREPASGRHREWPDTLALTPLRQVGGSWTVIAEDGEEQNLPGREAKRLHPRPPGYSFISQINLNLSEHTL